jgi:hypothetical protein
MKNENYKQSYGPVGLITYLIVFKTQNYTHHHLNLIR